MCLYIRRSLCVVPRIPQESAFTHLRMEQPPLRTQTVRQKPLLFPLICGAQENKASHSVFQKTGLPTCFLRMSSLPWVCGPNAEFSMEHPGQCLLLVCLHSKLSTPSLHTAPGDLTRAHLTGLGAQIVACSMTYEQT